VDLTDCLPRGINHQWPVKWGEMTQWGVNWQGPPFWQSTCTNHRNRGRTSADRSTEATLMLTVPRSLIKSSTKDLTWPSLEIVFWHTYTLVCSAAGVWCWYMTIATQVTVVKGGIIPASMDSDLEAFSHNPTDGSFAALSFQTTALPSIRTNGSSRTKLDYCRDNKFISRVKLTCLTTV
jgi:hypothetical protein